MSLDYQKEPEPEETEDVREEVTRATPVTPYYSYILIACLIVVFLTQVAVDSTQALGFGGIRSTLIAGFSKKEFAYGEYWRILTGAALHGGIIHLFFNGYALLILGRAMEILSNRAHLAIVFLFSVIGGGFLSFFFTPDGTSIGASGGIIGFLGYLTVYGFYRRKLLSNAFLKNMLFNIGFIALFGVVILPLLGRSESIDVPRVDNFGHLGGLLAGAIYGFFQIPRDLYKDPRETNETMEMVGYAALGIFIFVSFLTILLLLQIIRF